MARPNVSNLPHDVTEDRMATKAGRIISVGGGKGGVGKSLLATNLAVGMAQEGARVVLVDGDLGSPNLHTMLGMDRTGPTLHGVFHHTITHLEEARLETGIPNLSLVPGSQASVGAANIGHAQKLKMLRQLGTLDADVVLVDVGAGVSFNTLDLFNAADLKLVVMTTQLTSIQNAYGFLKGSVHRMVRQLCQDPAQLELLERADTVETASMPQLLARIRPTHASFVDALECALDHHGAFLVPNMFSNPRETSVVHAVQRMMVDYLRVSLPILGPVMLEPALHGSVGQRRPLMAQAGRNSSTETFRALAQALLREPVERLRNGRAAAEETATQSGAEPRVAPLPVDYGRYARRHPRHVLGMGAVVVAHGARVDGRVVDVSQGGCLLEVGLPLEVGAKVELELPALLGPAPLQLVVRNRRESGHVGAEFTAGPAMDEALLAARVAQLVAARAAAPTHNQPAA